MAAEAAPAIEAGTGAVQKTKIGSSGSRGSDTSGDSNNGNKTRALDMHTRIRAETDE